MEVSGMSVTSKFKYSYLLFSATIVHLPCHMVHKTCHVEFLFSRYKDLVNGIDAHVV